MSLLRNNWTDGEAFAHTDQNDVANAVNDKVDKATVTAKGDLFVATNSGTVTNLPAGNDGRMLVADSTQATGVNWSNEIVSPTVVGATGTDVMTLKLPDGTTVFTFNQYGELVSQVGYGVHYDGNVGTTAFSTYGPLFLTSGKGSADDHDVTIAPSGAGKINLSGATEVGGVPVVTTTGTQTLTGKTISGADNSISAIPQSAVTSLVDDLAGKEDASNKGTANGYAALDGDGLVPLAQLPVTQADWDTLEGKPAVIAAGATEADARAAIGAEYTGNKGQMGGYAALDESGRVPLAQVPPGLVIDGVQVSDDAFQLLSGDDPVGDPISLLVSVADGGTPYTTEVLRIDGGRLS